MKIKWQYVPRKERKERQGKIVKQTGHGRGLFELGVLGAENFFTSCCPTI
jgi:hypothetical protein